MLLGNDSSLFKSIACFLVISFSCVVFVQPMARARTDFTHSPESESSSSNTYDRESDMQVVKEALEREKVRAKLEKLGFTINEIQERLSRLSDEEIHQMAQQIEQVKAGGHLGVNELSVAMLIILIILAPVVAVVWVILMIFGEELHLHKNGGLHHKHK